MTKLGFKSITIPDSLYWILSTTAKINKISIGKVIEQGVLGGSPPTPEAQVLSGLYYEPINAFCEKAGKNGTNTKDFEMFLIVQRNLNDSTVNKHVAYAQTFYKTKLSCCDHTEYTLKW